MRFFRDGLERTLNFLTSTPENPQKLIQIIEKAATTISQEVEKSKKSGETELEKLVRSLPFFKMQDGKDGMVFDDDINNELLHVNNSIKRFQTKFIPKQFVRTEEPLRKFMAEMPFLKIGDVPDRLRQLINELK